MNLFFKKIGILPFHDAVNKARTRIEEQEREIQLLKERYDRRFRN